MRKSNKKIGASTVGTTLQVLPKFSKQQKPLLRPDTHKLLASKYTRSISSFGNNFKETPEKKNMIFHQKVKSSLHKPNLSPLQNVANVFSSSIKSCTEEELLKDVEDRFHVGRKVAIQCSMSQEFHGLLEVFRGYTYAIIDQMLAFHRQKLSEYVHEIKQICQYYEHRLKTERKQVQRKIQQSIINSSSQLGHKLSSNCGKAIFSTKIFNEMQLSGIDLTTWIKNSDLMNKFVSRVEYGVTSSEMAQSAFQTPLVGQQNNHNKAIQKVVEEEDEESSKKSYSIEPLEILQPISKTYR